MTNAVDLLDQAITLQEGDIVVFTAKDPLTDEQAADIRKAVASRFDPLGITFFVTSGLDVTVMRPETNSTAERAGSHKETA